MKIIGTVRYRDEDAKKLEQAGGQAKAPETPLAAPSTPAQQAPAKPKPAAK